LAFPLLLAVRAFTQDVPVHSLVPGTPVGGGNVQQLVYSPDGKQLLVLTTVGFQVRETATGSLLNSVVRPDWQWAGVCWSFDGKRMIFSTGAVEIWSPRGGKPEKVISTDSPFLARSPIACSPAAAKVAGFTLSGISVLDLDSGRRALIPLPTSDRDGPSIGGVAWSPDGTKLAIAEQRAASEVIRIWDLRRVKLVQTISVGQAAGSPITRSAFLNQSVRQLGGIDRTSSVLRWSPDGQVLGLNSEFSGLSLWTVRDGSLLARPRQVAPVISLSWSQDSRQLHVGSPYQVRYLDRTTGAPQYAIETVKYMRANSTSSNGNVAAFFDDGQIDLWRGTEDLPYVHIAQGIGDQVATLSPDLRRMLGKFGPGPVGMWDLKSGKRLADPATNHEWGYGQWAWSPDGETVAGLKDSEVVLLRGSTGEIFRTFTIPDHLNNHEVSWSPDGKRILAYGDTQPIAVTLETGKVERLASGREPLMWNQKSELLVSPIPGSNPLVSPNFRYAATANNRDELIVWDTQTHGTLFVIQKSLPYSSPWSAAWSPDSAHLAYTLELGQRTVDIWGIASKQLEQRWKIGGTGYLGALAWRTKLTAVEAMGGAVRLWQTP
jgi:WD40 repeat protein